MSTSVRDQYLRLKRQFSQAILFFRLGDFYEMFDEDALTGSRELDLTLTTREFAGGEHAPMCGVPYHAVETHLARLVSRGYTVAIGEQIGDPRTAKGLVQREVVRVVTPSSTLVRRRQPAPGRPSDDGGATPGPMNAGASAISIVGVPPAIASGTTGPAPSDTDPRVDVSPVEVRMLVATPVVQLALFEGIDEQRCHKNGVLVADVHKPGALQPGTHLGRTCRRGRRRTGDHRRTAR